VTTQQSSGRTYVIKARVNKLLLRETKLAVNHVSTEVSLCNSGNVAVDSAKFFSLSQYQRTRGHPYKIYRQPCRLNVSLYSFANTIIDIWEE